MKNEQIVLRTRFVKRRNNVRNNNRSKQKQNSNSLNCKGYKKIETAEFTIIYFEVPAKINHQYNSMKH